MDEPTGGLDVSVQARLLDLLRGLVADSASPSIIVTHDLAVARLLSHRMMVMKDGRVDRDRADRPGARRSARALHPAARLLDPAGCMTRMHRHAMVRLDGVAKTLHHASARRRRLPRRRATSPSRSRAGECVVLGGPSGAGKSLDPEDGLRQLPRRRRQHPGRATAASWSTSPAPTPRARARRCAARRIGYVSQFLRVVPRVARARRRRRAAASRAASTRDEARERAPRELLARLNLPRAAVAPAAGDLLRRRAAARQHRPRLHRRASDPAARRADRLARRRQPRGRRRADPREASAAGVGAPRHLPRRRGARAVADRVIDVTALSQPERLADEPMHDCVIRERQGRAAGRGRRAAGSRSTTGASPRSARAARRSAASISAATC